MRGIIVCHPEESIQQVAEMSRWIQPSTAEFPVPSVDQRKAYVVQACEKLETPGKAEGMWDGKSCAGDVGVQSLMDFVYRKENASLASTLRDTAKKLEATARHLDSRDKYGAEGSIIAKRKREDFEDVELNLQVATKNLRDLKKTRLSLKAQVAAEVDRPALVRDETSLTSNQVALTPTRPSQRPTAGTTATPERESYPSRHSLIVRLKVPGHKFLEPPLRRVLWFTPSLGDKRTPGL